jgi:hypothetical protein
MPPRLLHVQVPQPLADQSRAGTIIRSIPVNRTTVTAPQIASYILEEKYLQVAPYAGIFHPFDGPLAKANLVSSSGNAQHGRYVSDGTNRSFHSDTSSGDLRKFLRGCSWLWCPLPAETSCKSNNYSRIRLTKTFC